MCRTPEPYNNCVRVGTVYVYSSGIFVVETSLKKLEQVMKVLNLMLHVACMMWLIIYRDMKSANVLVKNENGECVIADLGFAMILDPTLDSKQLASTGQVCCTCLR